MFRLLAVLMPDYFVYTIFLKLGMCLSSSYRREIMSAHILYSMCCLFLQNSLRPLVYDDTFHRLQPVTTVCVRPGVSVVYLSDSYNVGLADTFSPAKLMWFNLF